jgi:hypothetical protein
VSTRSRFVVLCLLAAFVLACAAVVVWRLAGPEQTTNRVTLSADGVRWTSGIEDTFFFSETQWAPGETRTAVFWVRNDADVRADVDVALTTTAGADLAHSGLLEVSAEVGDSDHRQPFVAERDLNTVRMGELGPGERATVTLRGVLAGAVDVDSASVRYRVSGSGTSVEEPRSPLDATGAHLELAPLFLGVALLVTALVMRRSRPRRPQAGRRP